MTTQPKTTVTEERGRCSWLIRATISGPTLEAVQDAETDYLYTYPPPGYQTRAVSAYIYTADGVKRYYERDNNCD
jgi:aminoglycoside phosphotransferase